MSRETERVFKSIHEMLAQHDTENMSMEEVNALIEQHINKLNQTAPFRMTEKDAKTADDFLELVEEAMAVGDKTKALRLVRKAIKLDPDNLDAKLTEIHLSEKNATRYLSRIRQLADQGRRQLEKAGYFTEEYIGNFWGVLETRPYMRVRYEYATTLKDLGMLRRAVDEAEDMIRLCTNDNLGLRYMLMHIYAALEEPEAAEALLQKYSDTEEGQMLLPLVLLYYKLGDTTKAEDYARRLSKSNKETKQFVRAYFDGSLKQKLEDVLSQPGYAPYTEQELIMALHDNGGLYDATPAFFIWVAGVLKVKC